MSEEEMTKYAVVLDEKIKEGSPQAELTHCPICIRKLDDGGACPIHGTEPFEKPNKE